MALNFPNSPAVNDLYSVNGVVYQWTGVKWILVPGPSTVLGTAASRNVPAVGNAAPAEVVLGADTRLIPAPAGKLLKHQSGIITNLSANNQIAWSNSLPGSSDGVQLLSIPYTPVSTTSTIVLAFTNHYAHTNRDSVITTALFRNGTCVNAKPSSEGTRNNNQTRGMTTLTHSDTVTRTTLSVITYVLRAGANTTGTTHINQGTSVQNYAGAGAGSYVIMEIAQ